MVALLWAKEKTRAALRLEELWNALTTRHVSLLCGYPMSGFPNQDKNLSFLQWVPRPYARTFRSIVSTLSGHFPLSVAMTGTTVRPAKAAAAAQHLFGPIVLPGRRHYNLV